MTLVRWLQLYCCAVNGTHSMELDEVNGTHSMKLDAVNGTHSMEFEDEDLVRRGAIGEIGRG